MGDGTGRKGDGARVDGVDVVDTVDLVDALLVGGCPSTVAVSPIRPIAHSLPGAPEWRDRLLRSLRATPRPPGLRWRQKQPRHLG